MTPAPAKRSRSRVREMLPPKKRAMAESQLIMEIASQVPPSRDPKPPPRRDPKVPPRRDHPPVKPAPAPKRAVAPTPTPAPRGVGVPDMYRVRNAKWAQHPGSHWKKAQLRGDRHGNLFVQEYIRAFGCMICNSKNATKAGVHRKAATEDGKLLAACSTCRTSYNRSLRPIDPAILNALIAQWNTEMLQAESATPLPAQK